MFISIYFVFVDFDYFNEIMTDKGNREKICESCILKIVTEFVVSTKSDDEKVSLSLFFAIHLSSILFFPTETL
jgi:hypothetical protein